MWINSQKKRSLAGLCKISMENDPVCNCLHPGNPNPLCLDIMVKTGLISLGDLVENIPDMVEPMNVSLTEEDMEITIREVYENNVVMESPENCRNQSKKSRRTSQEQSKKPRGKSKKKSGELQTQMQDPENKNPIIRFKFRQAKIRANKVKRAAKSIFNHRKTISSEAEWQLTH